MDPKTPMDGDLAQQGIHGACDAAVRGFDDVELLGETQNMGAEW